MVNIDYKDPRPIYEQVVSRYAELILKGVLQKDEQMPSVRNLAMDLSINPNTIQKAYMELERQGYIYSVKGRGSFVSGGDELLEKRMLSYLDRITQLSREAVGYGVSKDKIISRLEEEL